jgi:hypothetical protein
LEAKQAGNDTYKAVTVDETFTVTPDSDYCMPGLVPPASPQPPKTNTDASSILAALGNPVPFSFQAAGDKFLIYSSRLKANRKPTDTGKKMLTDEDQSTLAQIEATIDALANSDTNLSASPSASTPSTASANPSGASSPTPAYSLELPLPHASFFSGLVSTLSSINPTVFTVQGVGSDRIRVTSAKVPSCHDVTLFLRDVRHIAWQAYPEPPVAQEYHLASASDFVSAFAGSGSAASGNSNQSGAQSAGANTNSSPSGASPGQSGASTPAPSAGGAGSGGQGSSGGGGNASSSSSTSTPGASAATSGATTGATTGQSAPNSGNVGGQPNSSSTAGAPNTSASVHLINPDMFLFADVAPGNDGDITEKKRILAQIDLPRPEVLINVWSMQMSTTNVAQVGNFNSQLKRVVADYNNGLQEVIRLGFEHLKGEMLHPDYFDADFYRYVAGRYVGEPGSLPVATLQPDQVAAGMLGMRSSLLLKPDMRAPNGICPTNEYCLGYTTIFQPLEPSVMHLLLAIIGAQKPWDEACSAINYVESLTAGGTCWGNPTPESKQATQQSGSKKAQDSSKELTPETLRSEDCEQKDLSWYRDHASRHRHGGRPQVQLECFRQTAYALLGDTTKTNQATGAGLARAAIADFLFNYKMAQQYPHEFSPHELTLSAQKLDTVLSPFNIAFNRDIASFQEYLRKGIETCGRHGRIRESTSCPLGENWSGFENKSFTNDAILTVRTLSATPATVGVTTQNFMNDTQPGALSDLLASTVKEGAGSGAKASAAATVSDLLQKSPLPAQLFLNALKASQSTEIQIGKSINLKVTPHTLSGASSAELDLTLNVDDAADPTYYTPAQSKNNADVSRVSNHDVTTRVRVDSLKLVDISSFSATLQRSRYRFPLLPVPGFEVPYVGSLLGLPLPPAKEYHSSTAVLSAIVVPTAADLAYGLTFFSDRIVDAEHAENCYWPGDSSDPRLRYPCKLRKAVSLSDLGNAPIRNFNKAMVTCLATGGKAANPTFADVPYFQMTVQTSATNPCTDLNFTKVFPDVGDID